MKTRDRKEEQNEVMNKEITKGRKELRENEGINQSMTSKEERKKSKNKMKIERKKTLQLRCNYSLVAKVHTCSLICRQQSQSK